MQGGAHMAKRGPPMQSEKYEHIANINFSSITMRQLDQKWINEQPACCEYWRDIAKYVYKSSKLKLRIGLFLIWTKKGELRSRVSHKVVVAAKQSWDTELTVAI